MLAVRGGGACAALLVVLEPIAPALLVVVLVVVVQVQAQQIVLLAQLRVGQDALGAVQDAEGVDVSAGPVGMVPQGQAAVVLLHLVVIHFGGRAAAFQRLLLFILVLLLLRMKEGRSSVRGGRLGDVQVSVVPVRGEQKVEGRRRVQWRHVGAAATATAAAGL